MKPEVPKPLPAYLLQNRNLKKDETVEQYINRRYREAEDKLKLNQKKASNDKN